MGTRPMNIMMKIMAKSSMAVDKFSSPMSTTVGSTSHRMYLMAFGSAPEPSSFCMALRIWAVASTIVPLASSDGWKVKPGS